MWQLEDNYVPGVEPEGELGPCMISLADAEHDQRQETQSTT